MSISSWIPGALGLLLTLGAFGGCSGDSVPCTACDGGSQDVGQSVTPDLAPPDTIAIDTTVVADSGAPYTHEDVSPEQVDGWIKAQKDMLIVDVREPSEFAAGHIAGAINLAWISQVLHASLDSLPTDKPIVVHCQSGTRSNAAAPFLVSKGFKPVYDMQGGIAAWKNAGLPVVQ